MNEELILKTSHYSLNPFHAENIHFQSLIKKIAIKRVRGKHVISFENHNSISIKEYSTFLLNKKLCTFKLNNEVVGDCMIVSRTTLDYIDFRINFVVDIGEINELLCLILFIIEYSDFDSG